jgi:O-antigen ligase
MMMTLGRNQIPKPPLLVKLVLLSTLVFPSYFVLGAMGASGSVGQILALALFALWLTATAFGLHNPFLFGHPGRAAMMFWLVASCASYVAMSAGMSGAVDGLERAAADRWLLLIIAGAGVSLVVTETIRTLEDVKAVARWVMAGAALCGVVALIQSAWKVNPVDWIASIMAGFENNGSGTAFQERDPFMRVSGTTMHPIELSAICCMLLPLAIWWAMFDTKTRLWIRIALPALLFTVNFLAVSRTGLLGLACAVVVFIPYLPRTAKKWAAVVVPAGIVAFYFLLPGILVTLYTAAVAGSSDTSITYRTADYPLAWDLFLDRPWLGSGPGTWMPGDLKSVFDNQYLLTLSNMGGIGLLALIGYFLVPFVACLIAAHYAKTQQVRVLAGAVAAAILVGASSAAAFDAMSFQTFALVYPFFVGLGGVVWLMTKEQSTGSPAAPEAASLAGKAKR